MNGPEFKTAREHLMKHMPGNAAWRNAPETTRHNPDAPRNTDDDSTRDR